MRGGAHAYWNGEIMEDSRYTKIEMTLEHGWKAKKTVSVSVPTEALRNYKNSIEKLRQSGVKTPFLYESNGTLILQVRDGPEWSMMPGCVSGMFARGLLSSVYGESRKLKDRGVASKEDLSDIGEADDLLKKFYDMQ